MDSTTTHREDRFCDSSMEVLCKVSKYVIKIMDLLKEST